MTKQSLLFVYNAKSGRLNAGLDFLHKALSPATYRCNLCQVTYGMFTERAKWKKYREQKGVEMKFYYKDEFEKLFGAPMEYPVIIQSPGMKVFMTRDEINKIEDLDQLIESINKTLDRLNAE